MHPSDVIVNSSNKYLQPGSGVCGAIFKRAGAELLAEANEVMKDVTQLPINHTILTRAYNLPASKIVHVITPKTHEDNLHKAYENVVKEVEYIKCDSISIPLLGTGVYGHSIEHSFDAFKKAFEKSTKKQVYLFTDKPKILNALISNSQ